MLKSIWSRTFSLNNPSLNCVTLQINYSYLIKAQINESLPWITFLQAFAFSASVSVLISPHQLPPFNLFAAHRKILSKHQLIGFKCITFSKHLPLIKSRPSVVLLWISCWWWVLGRGQRLKGQGCCRLTSRGLCSRMEAGEKHPTGGQFWTFTAETT